MSSSVLDRVRQIASDVLQVSLDRVTAQSSPQDFENWDSVQHLNLVLALEQEFGLQFEPEEMDQMKTLGHITELLKSKGQ
jgi:acyl carrier protein